MDAALNTLKLKFAARDEADAALLARCRAGEREAFGILLHRYRDRIVSLAFHLLRHRDDAEDVAQETFTQAFTSIHTFRNESQLFTWLYRITVNLCLHRQRRAKIWETYDETHDAQRTDVEEQATARLVLAQVLDSLSEPLRVALILHEAHDLSYDEIAAVLNIPVGTVASRINAARQKFREAWRAQNGEEL